MMNNNQSYSKVQFVGIVVALSYINRGIVVASFSANKKIIIPIYILSHYSDFHIIPKCGEIVKRKGIVCDVFNGVLEINLDCIEIINSHFLLSKRTFKFIAANYLQNIKYFAETHFFYPPNQYQYINFGLEAINNISLLFNILYSTDSPSLAKIQIIGIAISSSLNFFNKSNETFYLISRFNPESRRLPIFVKINTPSRKLNFKSIVQFHSYIYCIRADDYFSLISCFKSSKYEICDAHSQLDTLFDDFCNCFAFPKSILVSRIPKNNKFYSNIRISMHFFDCEVKIRKLNDIIHGWWSGWGYWDTPLSTNVRNTIILLSDFHDNLTKRIILVEINDNFFTNKNAFSVSIDKNPSVIDGNVFLDEVNLSAVYNWVIKNYGILSSENIDASELSKLEFVEPYFHNED